MERTYIEITMTMKSRINNKEPYIEQGLDLTFKIHQECNEITEIIRSIISKDFLVQFTDTTEQSQPLEGFFSWTMNQTYYFLFAGKWFVLLFVVWHN